MEKICITDVVLKRLEELRSNQKWSDVTFLVGDEEIQAHRVILAASSEYFAALLYGKFAESAQSVIKLNVPLEPFKLILKYFYTGTIHENQINADNMNEVFHLAQLYGLAELESAMVENLKNMISVETALRTRHLAALYDFTELLRVCDRFIDANAEPILEHKSFFALTEKQLEEMLQRDSFKAKEIQIFWAVQVWCDQNANANVQSAMSNVRFSLIDNADLVNVVRPSGRVEDKILLDAIQDKCNGENLRHRFPFLSEFLPKQKIYDLKNAYLVNYLKADLNFNLRYCVQVSLDNRDWTTVIDYLDYDCCSHQYLHFRSVKVRYIRFRSAHTECVGDIELMHTNQLVEMFEDIVVPIDNVVCASMGAMFLEGYEFNKKNWIVRSMSNAGSHSKFEIYLGQPYYVSSMRVRACGKSSSTFRIRTLGSRKDPWSDPLHHMEVVGGWHHFTFTARIVTQIKVDFDSSNGGQIQVECPSQDPAYLKERHAKLLQCHPL